MKLIYDIQDRPDLKHLIVYGLQQVMAVLSATVAIPMMVGHGCDPAAALFGAGLGTLCYAFFTKKKSPVFLSSSGAFVGSMLTAFAGAATIELGYLGLIIGALIAGLMYCAMAIAVKFTGTKWITKLIPPVVIGPTVAIIGLDLAAYAISIFTGQGYWGLLCGLIAMFVTVYFSTHGTKEIRLIPFLIGITAGYVVAIGLTLAGIPLVEIEHRALFSMPDFTFIKAFGAFGQLTPSYILTLFVAYAPVTFVALAEHIADHTNVSNIIGHDLLKDPGLHRTLVGDGVGSIVGAFFGGMPNTTYGESVACVAITRNASVMTIIVAAIECMILSFCGPLMAIIAAIPACVMGAVSILLYGFIAASGLNILSQVDLTDTRNSMVAAVILICGVGGLTVSIGPVTLTSVACALILGILTNKIIHLK